MIFTITGPSCAGKSTLEKRLVENHGFVRAISTTTRPRRASDSEQEYQFVSRERFEYELANDGMVESVSFGGNYYGLSVAEISRLLETGSNIAIVCEPIGQKQIKDWCEKNKVELFSIFIDSPESEISTRFISRIVEEMKTAKPSDYLRIIASYSARLNEMMTTERKWIADAYSGESTFDFLALQFCKENEDFVIGEILKESAKKKVSH